MTSLAIRFKRMVVGLPQSLVSHTAVGVAADLAERLNIELLAAFIADASLSAFAGSALARELRIWDQQWQTIDPAQTLRELESAANIARQRFAENTKSRNVNTRFDIIPDMEAIAGLIRASDLVAIIDPTHPGERITRQFTGLLEAAFNRAAAVLVLPGRIGRVAGPIVAVAAGSDDPSIRVGLEFAAMLEERLVVEIPRGVVLSSDIWTEAERLAVRLEPIVVTELGAHASTIAVASTRSNERLRVITRGRLLDDVPRLFSTTRGIPLLIIHPTGTGSSAAPATEGAPT